MSIIRNLPVGTLVRATECSVASTIGKVGVTTGGSLVRFDENLLNHSGDSGQAVHGIANTWSVIAGDEALTTGLRVQVTDDAEPEGGFTEPFMDWARGRQATVLGAAALAATTATIRVRFDDPWTGDGRTDRDFPQKYLRPVQTYVVGKQYTVTDARTATHNVGSTLVAEETRHDEATWAGGPFFVHGDNFYRGTEFAPANPDLTAPEPEADPERVRLVAELARLKVREEELVAEMVSESKARGWGNDLKDVLEEAGLDLPVVSRRIVVDYTMEHLPSYRLLANAAAEDSAKQTLFGRDADVSGVRFRHSFTVPFQCTFEVENTEPGCQCADRHDMNGSTPEVMEKMRGLLHSAYEPERAVVVSASCPLCG